MALQKLLNRNFTLVVFFAVLQLFSAQAQATLVFYYDPDTGNVSFDTTNTRSGEIFVYAFQIYETETPIRFLYENQIRLSYSSLISSASDSIGEVTFQGLRGLYTIGDVLPAGIPEDTWELLVANQPIEFDSRGRTIWNIVEGALGYHSYADRLGGGAPPISEFIYGRPEGEFENKWDLIDPDILGWAQAAKLIYRQATGELIYDTSGEDGGYTVGFYLQSDGQFIPGEFVAPWESPFNSASSNQIDMLANAVEPGAYSLGNILQPGEHSSAWALNG